MLATLSVLIALLPQGDVRSAGRVVDAHGQPVASAKVLFLARPIARSLEAGPEDRRVVTTDERGRYRIDLDRERRYTAWASWPDGATDCVEGVSGGEFLDLRGHPNARATELRLPGLEAWPGFETFTVRAVVGGENLDYVSAVRDGDSWRLPPMPFIGVRAFEVLDAAGEVRWCSSYSGNRVVVESAVPELAHWQVEIVDAQCAPLAGVTLRWHIRNYWYSASECLPYGQRFSALWPVACVTDAAGKGSVHVPFVNGQRDLWMMAVKDGYTMSQEGIKDGKRFSNGVQVPVQPEDTNEPFRIVLQKSDPVTIDFREPSGRCSVAGWLACSMRVNIKHKGGGYGTIMQLVVPIEHGKAVLHSPVPPGTEVEIVETRLSDQLHAELVKAHGSAPWQWRSLGPGGLLDGKPGVDPFALLNPVRVQVTSVDGRPASRVAVMFEGRGGSIQGVRTDRVGKAWLPGPGLRVGSIVAADEQGFAFASVTDPTAVVKMQLLPFQHAKIRVVDTDGKAVAGVGVRASNCQVVDASKAVGWGFGVVMPFRRMAVSDEAGWATLAVPPFVCDMRLSCSRQVQDGDSLSWNPSSPADHSIVVGPRR